MRLLNAENLRRLYLRQTTLLQNPRNLQREPRLGQLLVRILKAKISKNIAATFCHSVRITYFLNATHSSPCPSLKCRSAAAYRR
jgi:hypothetical protein